MNATAKFGWVILGLLGVVVIIGTQIGTSVSAPDYAVVYVDDQARTVIALPCADDWKNKPNSPPAILRRTTMGEADKIGYSADRDCIEAGGFIEDGPNLTELALNKIGLWPSPEYWWDKPYRTEARVVSPNRR